MKKTIALLLNFLMVFAVSVPAQELSYGQEQVDTLSSPYFWGRGYTKEGMQKASVYLADQFKAIGLKPVGDSYFQRFSYPVNTFPGDMELSINGKRLLPGKDFIVNPESRGIEAKGVLVPYDSVHFVNREAGLVIKVKEKLTWSVAPKAAAYTGVELLKGALADKPESFQATIENKEIPAFKASNICGILPGKHPADSVLVFTAHYDHLGGMGRETYFPGANDNASGVALLLGLARYFKQHPPDYTVVFIAFAGEEAGLLGSAYYTSHPLFKLSRIAMLVNLDLEGNGAGGITVVNGSIYPQAFKLMQDINGQQHDLPAIHIRGKAANSDHYWFSEKGVPALFIYTEGGVKFYHDVFDRAATLPLDHYTQLIDLLTRFGDAYMTRD